MFHYSERRLNRVIRVWYGSGIRSVYLEVGPVEVRVDVDLTTCTASLLGIECRIVEPGTVEWFIGEMFVGASMV